VVSGITAQTAGCVHEFYDLYIITRVYETVGNCPNISEPSSHARRNAPLIFKLESEDTSFRLLKWNGKVEFIPVHAMQTYKELELHLFFTSEMGGDDRLVSCPSRFKFRKGALIANPRSLGGTQRPSEAVGEGNVIMDGNRAHDSSDVRPTA
jgi:hypothetical protein